MAQRPSLCGVTVSVGTAIDRLHPQSPDSTPHALLSQCTRTVGTRIYGVRRSNEESIMSFFLASRRPLAFSRLPETGFDSDIPLAALQARHATNPFLLPRTVSTITLHILAIRCTDRHIS